MTTALIIDLIILSLLTLTGFAIAKVKDLFAAVMLSGIYGLLSASFFVINDAVDVAFTEASVGAGIFPLLMLAVLSLVDRYEKPPKTRNWIPALISIGIVITLCMAITQIPGFGDPDAPANTHVAERYIQDSPQEVGIPNMVTSVLASYRGFDTFGEVVVVFTAAIGVLVLLLPGTFRETPHRTIGSADMVEHKVLRVVGKMLIPFMLIFALYVQFHGDYGPGGGFQAGVIFAAGIILYAMLFGIEAAHRVVPPGVLRVISALGVLVYGSVGLVSLANGGNYLDYDVLLSDPIAGQHVGILAIEFGVGITVAAAMILIFFAFSEAAHSDEGGVS